MEDEFIPCVVCGQPTEEDDPVIGPHCAICFNVKVRLRHFLSHQEGRKFVYHLLIELADTWLVT